MTTLWIIYNLKHETTKLEMKDGAKNVYLTFHETMCGAFFKNTLAIFFCVTSFLFGLTQVS